MRRDELRVANFADLENKEQLYIGVGGDYVEAILVTPIKELKDTNIEFNVHGIRALQVRNKNEVFVRKVEMFYIQNGYVGNAILWWINGDGGYLTDFTKAKKFTKEEALVVIQNKSFTAWPCSYVDQAEEAKKFIIDSQYLDSSNTLKQ